MEAYLESGKAADRLAQHLQEVRENGISGVPTFVIGDKMVVGAQPYEVLKKVRSEELASDSRKGETKL